MITPFRTPSTATACSNLLATVASTRKCLVLQVSPLSSLPLSPPPSVPSSLRSTFCSLFLSTLHLLFPLFSSSLPSTTFSSLPPPPLYLLFFSNSTSFSSLPPPPLFLFLSTLHFLCSLSLLPLDILPSLPSLFSLPPPPCSLSPLHSTLHHFFCSLSSLPVYPVSSPLPLTSVVPSSFSLPSTFLSTASFPSRCLSCDRFMAVVSAGTKLLLSMNKMTQLLEQLRTQVHSRKYKNVDILSLSQEVHVCSEQWLHVWHLVLFNHQK